MDKNKHMDIYARLTIQGCLDNGKSFKAIGKETGKDCTTIAKEVKNHLICERKGAYGRSFCDCVHYTETCRKPDCQKDCTDYRKYECPLLSKPPYVCNGCKSRSKCTLEKHIYDAVAAQKEYTAVKSECRAGFNLTEGEISALDDIISPLILKGQSSKAAPFFLPYTLYFRSSSWLSGGTTMIHSQSLTSSTGCTISWEGRLT